MNALERKINLLWEKYIQSENARIDLQIRLEEVSNELSIVQARVEELSRPEESSVQEETQINYTSDFAY